MRGGGSTLPRFSLGTLGARVQLCWSAQAAPYPHIFQPEDQSSEKSRPSVNVVTIRNPKTSAAF